MKPCLQPPEPESFQCSPCTPKVSLAGARTGCVSLGKFDSMIHSMTGYGKATGSIGPRRYTVELRSLNGKQLDLSIRMPQAFREQEMELRKQLAHEVTRGKSDLSIQYEEEAGEARGLNLSLLQKYLTDLEALADARGYARDGSLLSTAMRLPDTLQQSSNEMDDETWKALRVLIAESTRGFQEFRQREGEVMAEDFRRRIAAILAFEKTLSPLLDQRIQRVRDRIQTNFEEIKDRGRLDENRFEQEVLFYIEKMDVSEERVRLNAHCTYFVEMLDEPKGQGKKLGFIAQEMGREINTLGSKANDAEIQRLVVQMKDELEKIKEQVLNVL